MPDRYWTGGGDGIDFDHASGNFTAAWGDADVVHITRTANNITTGFAQAAHTISLDVGGTFSGTLASLANPLNIGTLTKLTYDAQFCTACWLNASTTCTRAIVRRTNGLYGCLTIVAGTWADFLVYGGQGLHFAGGTLTSLKSMQNSGSAQAISGVIDAAVTITAADLQAGDWAIACGLGTMIVEHANVRHDAAGTTTTSLTVRSGGVVTGLGITVTYTAVNVYAGGTFDLSQDAEPKVLTALNAYPGAIVIADNGRSNITGTINNYGAATLLAGPGLTVNNLVGGAVI